MQSCTKVVSCTSAKVHRKTQHLYCELPCNSRASGQGATSLGAVPLPLYKIWRGLSPEQRCVKASFPRHTALTLLLCLVRLGLPVNEAADESTEREAEKR